jgi:hypothetical protein
VIDAEIGNNYRRGIAKTRLIALTNRVIKKADEGDRFAVIIMKGGSLLRREPFEKAIDLVVRDEPREISGARIRKDKVLQDTTPKQVLPGVPAGTYSSRNMPDISPEAKALADEIRQQAKDRRDADPEAFNVDASVGFVHNCHPSVGVTGKRHPGLNSI